MSEPVKVKKSKHAALWRAVRYTFPYRGMIAISVVCALFMGLITTTGISAILPILKVLVEGQTVGGWVEQAIAQHGGDVPVHLRAARWAAGFIPDRPVYAIATIFGFIACMAVLGSCFRFVHEHLSDRVAIYAVNDFRRRLYDHLLHLPLGYFGKHGTSDVTSRLVGDAAQLQDGIRVLLGQMVQAPISAVMALGLAFWINWKLTLVILLFIPPMFAVMRKLGTKVRRAMRAALQKSAGMLGQIDATLQGIRAVKAARAERFERRRYRGIMRGIIREQIRMSRYEAFTTPAMETMALMAIGVLLLIASWMMFEKRWLQPTEFMMIMIALASIAEPMRRLSKLNNVTQRANAAATRMFEVLDEPGEREQAAVPVLQERRLAPDGQGEARAEPPRGEPKPAIGAPRTVAATGALTATRVLPPIARDIVFDEVSFSYPNNPALALDRVTLRVPKGKSVAVVGRNGSGKTTLLALLPRFYDPVGGAVLIDGVDLRQVTLRSLRRQIALVTQDSVIFPGTIAQNIAYGHPLAMRLAADGGSAAVALLRKEIQDAAARAFAHDFILAKPQGYDTPLDGLGGQLSGGQKQRLCIARAILRKAPILILDEATSQVDAESEHLIQQAIEGLMHESTTFVIAHRFSTILSADTIVVMDAGRIVGQGRHEELMRNCEIYQQLYERQMISTAG